MKYTFLAVAFAVATLTACAHKPAPVVVTESKVVKAPAKKCCPKAAAKKVAAKKAAAPAATPAEKK